MREMHVIASLVDIAIAMRYWNSERSPVMKTIKNFLSLGVAILAFMMAFAVCAGYALQFGFRVEKDSWINIPILPIALFASYFAGMMCNGALNGRKLTEVFETNESLITGTILVTVVVQGVAAYYVMADSPRWANAIIVLLYFILIELIQKKR
jgi:hypothetical protein